MKRRIIIITNAGKIGAENYCEGVFRDIENYRNFFKAPYGGYFSDSEIRFLDRPSKSKVREELKLLVDDNIVFSIIIFCGHGWYSTISKSNIFHLNDSEQIDSLEFRVGAKKRIIIEDNCRKAHAEYLSENFMKSFSGAAAMLEGRLHLNPEQCKIQYNKRISECQDQIIIGQACDINEVAGDSSSKGGYYSSSLIKAAENKILAELKAMNFYSMSKTFGFPICHSDSVPLVQSLSGGTQNPQIAKPRMVYPTEFLPFAVVA